MATVRKGANLFKRLPEGLIIQLFEGAPSRKAPVGSGYFPRAKKAMASTSLTKAC